MQLPSLPFQLPSGSNTAGTAAGSLAGGLAFSYLSGQLWIPPIAAAVGMTPAGVVGFMALGVAMLVNYGVTHYAELRGLEDLAKLWSKVKFERTYPGDPSAPPAQTGPNININKPVDLPSNIAGHTVTPTDK